MLGINEADASKRRWLDKKYICFVWQMIESSTSSDKLIEDYSNNLYKPRIQVDMNEDCSKG